MPVCTIYQLLHRGSLQFPARDPDIYRLYTGVAFVVQNPDLLPLFYVSPVRISSQDMEVALHGFQMRSVQVCGTLSST